MCYGWEAAELQESEVSKHSPLGKQVSAPILCLIIGNIWQCPTLVEAAEKNERHLVGLVQQVKGVCRKEARQLQLVAFPACQLLLHSTLSSIRILRIPINDLTQDKALVLMALMACP